MEKMVVMTEETAQNDEVHNKLGHSVNHSHLRCARPQFIVPENRLK